MKRKILCILLLGLLLCTACGNREQPIQNIPPAETSDGPLTPPDIDLSMFETRIRVVAAGDNIAHDSVVQTAREDANGTEYDFSEIYAGIADLVGGADIAFVNQEAPVGGTALGISGYPNFNAPNEMVEELISVGFDVFNIANNHMLDKGEKGYKNTIQYFGTLPVTMIGGYTKNDYDNLRIVERQGVKIAFLSYTTLVNAGHSGDLGANSAYKIPYANNTDITRQVKLAKENADVVIVSMHWGTENTFKVTTEQQKYAKLCADLGVDVVLGHHSHVVGKVEYLTGASGKKTLVAYSLGNLCSTMLNSYNMVGEILCFDIVLDTDGNVTLENVIVEPVVSHYKTDTSRKDNQNLHVRYASRVYLMRDYTDALAKEHGSQNWGAFTFETLKKYVTDTVSAEFLPAYLQ